MKTKITIFLLVLMFSAFAASAWGSDDTTNNTLYGLSAGNLTMTGEFNTFIGYASGNANTSGYNNAFLGAYAGNINSTGHDNTFLGHEAGSYNTTGYNNTYIGSYAGYFNDSGIGNVFIGYNAGYNETTSNKLYIDNSDTDTPLIYGEFDTNIVTVHGNLGIGTKVPVRQLHVVGDQAVFRMDRPADTAAFMLVRTDAGGTPLKTFVVGANASGSNSGSFVINDLGTAVSGAGTRRLTIDNNGNATFTNSVYALSFVPTSSIAYKTNVKTFENALETVKKLRGVRFDWKDSNKASVGLIAEEVENVVPEVVAHEGKRVTGLNYDSLVGVLVEAVKEQQKLIEAQKETVAQQERTISALSEKVAQLERTFILSNAVSKAD
jgi:hypothetical protein